MLCFLPRATGRRARGVDYYTLGAAYYLGVEQEDFAPYVVKLGQLNPVLKELFAELYGLILDRFEQVFGCPCGFHDELALPGFHVFGPRPGRLPSFLNLPYFARGGSIHNHPTPRFLVELMSSAGVSLPSCLDSVTIPLRLPAGGGGLNVWPNGLDNEEPVYRPYSEGKAVHFSGDLWHQVAPYQPSLGVVRPDYRVTLQCHFFCLEGTIILFWC